MKVGDFINNGSFDFPQQLITLLNGSSLQWQDIDIPQFDCEDELIWEGSQSGRLTVKEAHNFYRERGIEVNWYKNLWQKFVPPRVSIFAWKILHNCLPTDDNANRRGIIVEGGCALCDSPTVLEDQEHLFIQCDFAKLVWCWLSTLLHLDLSFLTSLRELLRWCVRRPMSNQYNQVILSIILNTLWAIWKYRNKAIFERRRNTVVSCIRKIKKSVANAAFLFHGKIRNSVAESALLRALTVTPRYKDALGIKEIRWVNPPPSWHKCNVDGAAKGSPGAATCAGVFRNYRGFHRGSFAKPIGVQFALFAEIMAFIIAVDIACHKGWFPIWFETDSELLVIKVTSKTMDVPWRLRNKWRRCLHLLSDKLFSISHIYREGNAVADAVANEGFYIDDITWWYELPLRARKFYFRNICGTVEYRCKN